MDFFAGAAVNNFSSLVGTRRPLTFSSTATTSATGYAVTSPYAYLTSFSVQAQVGDFIRGSATFKLSDQG